MGLNHDILSCILIVCHVDIFFSKSVRIGDIQQILEWGNCDHYYWENTSWDFSVNLSNPLKFFHTFSQLHFPLSSAHTAGSPYLTGGATQSLYGFLWFFVRCSCTWCCLLAYSSHQRERLFLFLWRGDSKVLSFLVESHRRDYVGRTTPFQPSNTMSQNLYETLTSASLTDSVFMDSWSKSMES